jgi:hypothetical protein
VNVVVKVYRAGIMPSNRGELWVVIVKSRNVRINVEDAIACFQISVALDAGIVGGGREANGAAMLDVARAASRSERLMWIVGRRLVTSQAGVIRDGCAKTSRAEVAQTATVAENSVGFRDRPGAVDVLMAEQIRAQNPAQGEHWHTDRKPHLPAAEGMKPGEVLQVDPLGYRLGCAHARHS